MPLDPESRDANINATTNGTTEPTPGTTAAGSTPAGELPGTEQPAAAPRRRATRARTTKKAAAAVTGTDAESGQLPIPAGPDATGTQATGSSSSTISTSSAPTSSAGSDTVAQPAAESGSGTGVAPEGEPQAVTPVKRTRAPRKRAAPRAAPRTTVDADSDAATGPADSAVPAVDGGSQSGPVLDLSAADTADALASVAGTEGSASAQSSSDQFSAAPAGSVPVEPTVAEPVQTDPAPADSGLAEPVAEPAKKATRRRTRKAVSPAFSTGTDPAVTPEQVTPVAAPAATVPAPAGFTAPSDEPVDDAAPAARVPIMPLFQAPEPVAPRPRRAASRPAGPPKAPVDPASEIVPEPVAAEVAAEPLAAEDEPAEVELDLTADLVDLAELVDDVDQVEDVVGEELDVEDDEDDENADILDGEGSTPRRRRRRGGRGRRGRGRTDAGDEDGSPEPGGQDEDAPAATIDDADPDAGAEDDEIEEAAGESSGSRRRRRRRRRGAGGAEAEGGSEDAPNVVTKVREPRRDDVTAVRGSTRLEAKKQRRREGREAGRRRTILTEAEFLTRRESVDRVMVVRELEGRTQIGVLEDGLLVEHYVARKTQTSTVGNVYLGRVQNVLPSMEAAFVDIGKGRNAVLYAGEVNWDAAGLDGQPRRIEHALKAGEAVLVQVTKDPIGHKGARLTSQISMPGRYLVYVPDGSMTGISRKLPDTERSRLKKILREIVPDDAGVIVRTAAEGASDEELERDVARLQAQWDDISTKIKTVQAPAMLYGEPDLAIKVVRDIFNEDFGKLIVSGDEAWDTLQGYISHVAPDLAPRLERWTSSQDVFAAHRIDEQLAKALDRKVYLPSGGSLVIDRTEAMTVVDVNTGKFTGSGGNLEETVTKNNLEAAEEVVHQLRLRDIGGIIVVDFIDMVLESNRDLVLRRLLECLGRDRTRHQVAEVTSLGLVQMTRKRVGQGLIEVFSETCEHCGGRGLVMHDEPVEKKQQDVVVSSGGGGSRRHSGRH